MPTPDLNWGTIHPSAFGHAATLLRPAAATPRAHGAVRYQCPVTVLVTDEADLARLARPRARLRCNACGEIHLLTCERAGLDRRAEKRDSRAIVAAPA